MRGPDAGGDGPAVGRRWSQLSASKRGEMLELGRTLVSADLSDGRSSSGIETPSFCSSARRGREDQRSKKIVLEDSRKFMAPKECIKEEKPGYLELLSISSVGGQIHPSVPRKHGVEFLVRQRICFRVGHTVPVCKTFKPQDVRKRHIGEVLNKKAPRISQF
jgi:hypothetical protein